jgi:hypothetical protein
MKRMAEAVLDGYDSKLIHGGALMDGMQLKLGGDQRPDWRNTHLGTRIRVALWLVEIVGEGGTFAKQDLRDAMPGVEQIDRRMRDLRPAGWVIHTYRDRAALRPDELYLAQIGLPVWEPEHRNAGLRQLSAKTRREVFERDRHRCRRCGIAAGEEYPDAAGGIARLTIGHVSPHKSGSAATANDLLTECARCNETAQHLTGVQFSEEQVRDRISVLKREDKERLLQWVRADQRHFSALEDVWAQYRQLPGANRERLAVWLEGYFHGTGR